jgi:hypothetical protein
MRLIGYIRPFKEYSFSVPIYKNNNELFFHSLDSNYQIKEFILVSWQVDYIELTGNFPYAKVNDFGFIVFNGTNDEVIICRADDELIKIEEYLDRNRIRKKSYIRHEYDIIDESIRLFKIKEFIKHLAKNKYYKELISIHSKSQYLLRLIQEFEQSEEFRIGIIENDLNDKIYLTVRDIGEMIKEEKNILINFNFDTSPKYSSRDNFEKN